MRILMTGTSGFIGKRLIKINTSYDIARVSLQTTKVEEIDFTGIDAILHLAGMAHQMQKIDPKIYFDVNYDLTKDLAEAAKKAGVPHFVFVSTIKVFGEHQKQVLDESSPCTPIDDPYGESKLKAELFLQSIEDDQFKVAIVRPPLVYGPEVKGNLIRFLDLANQSFPLPFAGIENRRTMVFIDNLIELFNQIINKKASGIFLAGDRQPLSTTKLISEIRKGLGKKPSLFFFPKPLRYCLSLVKPNLAIRLFGSLEMNTSGTNEKLNFTPPYTIEEGLQVMVDWYKNKIKV